MILWSFLLSNLKPPPSQLSMKTTSQTLKDYGLWFQTMGPGSLLLNYHGLWGGCPAVWGCIHPESTSRNFETHLGSAGRYHGHLIFFSLGKLSNKCWEKNGGKSFEEGLFIHSFIPSFLPSFLHSVIRSFSQSVSQSVSHSLKQFVGSINSGASVLFLYAIAGTPKTFSNFHDFLKHESDDKRLWNLRKYIKLHWF